MRTKMTKHTQLKKKKKDWESRLAGLLADSDEVTYFKVFDLFNEALSSLTDPEELVREIDHLFKDHYWDSLQPDRKLLLKHWKFILTLLKSKKI